MRINAEIRYDKLLKAADYMERAGLISSDEWRKLVQQAGTSFANTAECMVDAKRRVMAVKNPSGAKSPGPAGL